MISATRNRLTAEISRQSQIQRDINDLQTQVSTGKRLQSASDDPTATVQVAQLRRTQGNETAYATNAATAATVASRVDTALTSVSTVLDRARELTVMAANDTYSDSDRVGFAAELRDLATSIAATSAQKDPRGQDLFPAGTPTTYAIGDTLTASGTLSQAAVFGSVATGGTTKSIADILESAAVAAESGTAADRTAAVGAVGDASDHVTQQHALQGVDAKRIDTVQNDLSNSAVTLTDQRGTLEGTDIAAAVTLIQSKLTTLQTAQSVFAKINQKTLFDVLS